MDKQFDVEAFKRFVASKPADEAYVFMDNCGCAVFQFFAAEGYPVASVGGSFWTDTNDQMHDLPPPLYWPDKGFGIVCEGERTFGALSERLSRLSTGEG